MKPGLTPARVQTAYEAAAMLFGIHVSAFARPRGNKRVTEARQAVYAALYAGCDTSTPEIGDALQKCHSTIVHGLHVVWQRCAIDGEYCAAVALIAAEAQA